jgi:PPK2 family polyphosphate:nucleotide phosphotransferase
MLVKPDTSVSLKDFDPADTDDYCSAEEAESDLRAQVEELARFQHLLYAESRRAVLIILQGMDTSGKDGTIRHVMSGMSPLGVQVKAFKAPTEEELAHDFLWRVHKAVPPRGYIGIFNRSHYEDVVVVRVRELVPRKVWKARYEQINQFEKILVKNGVVILKFFLHISKEEQRRRLEERLKDPEKRWKFSPQDLEDRRLWPAYRKAYEAVLSRCSTKWAPWHIVPADRKWYRNVVVAQTVVEALRGLDLKYPQPPEDWDKIVIE